MSSLTLKRSQIADFKSFASVLAGDDIRLSISDGVIRLFAIHLASGEAFTLGFFGDEIVYVPAAMYEGLEFKYEAMSSVFLGFDKVERIDNNEDVKHLEGHFSLMNWSLILSMIACSKTTDLKIERLIVILTFRFGSRNLRGYFLPFTLSHQRQSEILGCTRSTVTRYMLSLRKSGMIEVLGYDKAWIVSEQLISKHEMFVEGFFAQV